MIIEKVKNINIADFDYPLPDEKIARHPLAQRDACKLLVANPSAVTHTQFSALPGLLPENSLMVRNDTRVINARMKFAKPSGAVIEIFLLEPITPEDYVLMFQTTGSCRWSCMVGNLKRWKDTPLDKSLIVDGREVTLSAKLIGELPGNAREIEFSWTPEDVNFASIVDAAGYIPIPPYLKRASEECDADDYQTVYARVKGSVAAPTAGLHFTPDVLTNLADRGVEVESVTLHVGAGTFQPVKSDIIGEHPMHTEVFSVEKSLVDTLADSLESGRHITAVGTTSVRTLESLPLLGKHILETGTPTPVTQWEAYEQEASDMATVKADTVKYLHALSAWMTDNREEMLTSETSIMIAPGFCWRIVDAMVTNFHQPKSTLLLLVSSFLGNADDNTPRWRKIYEEALENSYRFLSYGDACLFTRF
jgi:S-adenosylmethionine:tRNA ribosyltransferase-isomerase